MSSSLTFAIFIELKLSSGSFCQVYVKLYISIVAFRDRVQVRVWQKKRVP